MRVLTGFVAGTLLFGIAPAHADTTPRIGTAALATNAVTGLLGTTRRTLKRGDGVFQNENIMTGANAGAQLLFQDETALTMGPDSQVILDKLIYDPNKRAGEMSIRAVTGAFRFVSGSAPKQGYSIKTPVGTIGVRGTIIQFWIKGLQLTLQLDEGGTYFCGAQNKCVELDKPGTYVVVTSQQVGSSQSKNAKECGSGGGAHCYITDGDQTLFIDFLGLGRVLNDLNPAAGPNFPPNNPPPPSGSFSPILNPGIGVPPGLAGKLDSLPRGLQDRCAGGSCTAPGKGKNH